MPDNELPIQHEVVAALIVHADLILLGRRSPNRAFYPDVWDLFGGHMEPGEAQAQTLVRELEEELGITPTTWTYMETLHVPSAQLTVHIYRVNAWVGTPTNIQPEEHSDISWFTLVQISQLPLADPSYPVLFARYLGVE